MRLTGTCATTARSLGSPSGRKPGPGGGGHSSSHADPAEREHLPGMGGDPPCAAWRAARPRLHRGRPAGAAVDHQARRGSARRTSSAAPSWSVSRVGDHERVEPLDAGLRSRRRIGPPGGPVSTSTATPSVWSSVASPWPTSRNETTSSPRRAAGPCARSTAAARPSAASATTATVRAGHAGRHDRRRNAHARARGHAAASARPRRLPARATHRARRAPRRRRPARAASASRTGSTARRRRRQRVRRPSRRRRAAARSGR